MHSGQTGHPHTHSLHVVQERQGNALTTLQPSPMNVTYFLLLVPSLLELLLPLYHVLFTAAITFRHFWRLIHLQLFLGQQTAWFRDGRTHPSSVWHSAHIANSSYLTNKTLKKCCKRKLKNVIKFFIVSVEVIATVSRLRSSGMWRRVVWGTGTDVSDEILASTMGGSLFQICNLYFMQWTHVLYHER